jgi:hypothetical protein
LKIGAFVVQLFDEVILFFHFILLFYVLFIIFLCFFFVLMFLKVSFDVMFKFILFFCAGFIAKDCCIGTLSYTSFLPYDEK